MTILLDSTILIDSLRGEPASVATFRQAIHQGHSLATSVINVGEVYAGARPKELNAIQRLFEELEVYPVSISIAKRAGDLRNAAARKGRTLELDDMLVAATALEFDLPVITANIKDFKGTGVTFFGAGEN